MPAPEAEHADAGPAPVAVLSEAQLEAWGRRIGESVVAEADAGALVLALRGQLGAGKSVLARAVARGAGVAQAMPSPTFNLVFVYDGAAGVRVHHLDLYRLEDPDEVWELGWQELGEGRQIVLVEWPERAERLLPAQRWDVRLAPAADDAGLREVRLSRVGSPPELPRP